MYERFTDRARKIMQLANQEAQQLNHNYIGTEHILLGLVKGGSGVATNVLKNLDINLGKIRLEVQKVVQHGPGGEQTVMDRLPHTHRTKKVIEFAIEGARTLNHNYVGSEHLLLGLLREQEGVAAQVLINLGLKLEVVREEVLNLLGHTEEHKIPKALRPGAVETYTVSDLTPTDASAPPESLTDAQIELIHERIRRLDEQAIRCRDETAALKRLLELYGWFRGQR